MSVWLYFDCYSGAAGDMLLGALVDAGLPVDGLRAALRGLPVSGYQLRAERVTRRAVTGTRLHVDVDGTDAAHRHLADIVALLDASALPAPVVARAAAVFRRLAEAEAAVHGTTVDEVHFHEVGAVDSIVDIVGTVWGLHELGVDRVFASALPLGEGWIDTAHGRLPVPAPATLRLLASSGAPTRPLAIQAEMVTPTAAALLSELAAWERPAMRLERVSYGFGARDLPWPNAVRAWLGHPAPEQAGKPVPQEGAESHPVGHRPGSGTPQAFEPVSDQAVLLECNLDDTTGQALGYALDRLLAAGALDAWLTPIYMKKNRPAVTLSVLALPDRAADLADLLLRETTTLGVRQSVVDRVKAGRATIQVETPWGPVRAKVKLLDGRPVAARPEYEDCAALARRAGVPFLAVYDAASAAGLQAIAGAGQAGDEPETGSDHA